jgi:hypothetical protein
LVLLFVMVEGSLANSLLATSLSFQRSMLPFLDARDSFQPLLPEFSSSSSSLLRSVACFSGVFECLSVFFDSHAYFPPGVALRIQCERAILCSLLL